MDVGVAKPWSWHITAQLCRGLGALIAEKFAAEGCDVAINYNASQERAKLVAEKIEKEYKSKAILIQGVYYCTFALLYNNTSNKVKVWQLT